jgi:CspA family cold shock protein
LFSDSSASIFKISVIEDPAYRRFVKRTRLAYPSISAMRYRVCGADVRAIINVQKGYGFIAPDDGSKDAFVHISAVERAGISTLSEGQRVSFDLQRGTNGKTSAENLKLA